MIMNLVTQQLHNQKLQNARIHVFMSSRYADHGLWIESEWNEIWKSVKNILEIEDVEMIFAVKVTRSVARRKKPINKYLENHHFKS